MEREHERPAMGSGEALAEWVEAHVAAAERLIRESHQAVERVTARVEQTHRRVQHTTRRSRTSPARPD